MKKPQLKTAGLVCASLLLGSIIGIFLSPMFQSFMAPADHKAIVGAITIRDTRTNVLLTPKLVESVNVKAGLSVIFTPGKEYSQTVWNWQTNGNTEIVTKVWGPDDTGEMYSIGLSRLSWEPFEVKINGVTQLTILAVTSTEPAIGYYQMDISWNFITA
jgi:hypothetical protein